VRGSKVDVSGQTRAGEVEVRGLPEGGVFSPDGNWLYIGNFMDSDISVLRVTGDTVTNTGTLLKLSGRPASMRGRTR
jgi:DNA-binding beta-propeller fold protein YncE